MKLGMILSGLFALIAAGSLVPTDAGQIPQRAAAPQTPSSTRVGTAARADQADNSNGNRKPDKHSGDENVTPDGAVLEIINRLESEGCAVQGVQGNTELGYTAFVNARAKPWVLKDLARLPRLRRLYLRAPWLRDQDMQSVSALTELELLYLDALLVTDEGVAKIAAIPQLHYVILSRLKMTDTGLAPLARLAELSSLSILECKRFHGKGLQHLANLPKLGELFVEDNALRDCELNHIDGPWKSLRRVVVTDDNLTDNGVRALAALPRHVTMIVLNNTKATTACMSALRGALPDTAILFSDLGRAPEKLRRIGDALVEYHCEHGKFPSPIVTADDHRTTYSWRVALLPYLGEQELFSLYRFDEPWTSPRNRSVLDHMPEIYRSEAAVTNETSFLAVTGDKTAFRKGGVALHDIFIDPGMEIMVVESDRRVPWTQPQDILYSDKQPVPRWTKKDGFNALYATGEVQFISWNRDPQWLRPLLSTSYLGDRRAESALRLKGARAPDFVLESLAGGKVRLSDLIKGKTALLCFSACGCQACCEEAPVLSDLYERYKAAGLAVVMVNSWDEPAEVVRSYVEKQRLKQSFLLGGGSIARSQYKLFEAPTSCWIDKRGVIVDVRFGFKSSDRSALDREAKRLLFPTQSAHR